MKSHQLPHVQSPEDAEAYEHEPRPSDPESQPSSQPTFDGVEALRSLIDLRHIAATEDPTGYQAASQQSTAIAYQASQAAKTLEAHQQRLLDLSHRQQEINSELQALSGSYATRQGSTIVRIKQFFHLKDHKLRNLQSTKDHLLTEQAELANETKSLSQSNDELTIIARSDYHQPIESFIERFETPLSPAEKESLLKFDALAQLSTEEYLRLWRRLNPHCLTHATRQGFRDHSDMEYHQKGLGEFHNGFTNILAADKSLQSASSLRSNEHNPSQEGDRTAIHFGQQIVLDNQYGAETGNEVFFVFPTDVICSQCLFSNGDISATHVHEKTNDLYVWPPDGTIPIDAGLVFLPKSTLFDPQTGSRYASQINAENQLDLIPDKSFRQNFTNWLKQLKLSDIPNPPLGDTDKSPHHPAYVNLRNKMRELHLDEPRINTLLADHADQLRKFADHGWFVYKEGVTIPTADGYRYLRRDQATPEEITADALNDFFGEYDNYSMAQNAIPAQVYWETYFQEHPDQRPKHIIYYDGDPRTVLSSTLKDYGIIDAARGISGSKNNTTARDGNRLGFDHHFVNDYEKDPRQNPIL